MDLEQQAIEWIRTASEMSCAYYEKPLIITTSGGKDSDVCIELAKRSGVSFEVQHSHTTADAPQTVYHVRQKFQELEGQGIPCEINYPAYQKKRVSMWSLIPKKLMPPTRTVRYCCTILKESAGKERVIVTGVRKEESSQRSSRGALEVLAKTKKQAVSVDADRDQDAEQITLGEIFLNNDNDPRRKILEHCELKSKIVCNPIINWTTRDVWDFIHSEKIDVNPLYQCGFHRVGCLGCPMAGKGRSWEFQQFPAYERMYRHAFERMLEVRKQQGKGVEWKNSDEVFRWWMEDENLDGQMKWEV